jgi:hypothetical protein
MKRKRLNKLFKELGIKREDYDTSKKVIGESIEFLRQKEIHPMAATICLLMWSRYMIRYLHKNKLESIDLDGMFYVLMSMEDEN